MFTVLGLDPGMARLGWGSVTIDGENMELGLCGMIAHPRDSADPYNKYLNKGIAQIVEEFPTLLALVRPNFIAAETVPAGRLGSRSELVVAAITSAKVIAFQFGLSWFDVAANTAKKELTGDGTASKAVVRNTIMGIFPVLAERHASEKQSQKALGEKVIGVPQDTFDGLLLAITGAKLHGDKFTG